MKTNIIFLLLLTALISSCSSHYYSVTTAKKGEVNYRVLEVEDSGIMAIPLQYQSELTPEVIREYGYFIPYDSMLDFRKKPKAGTGVGTALIGGLCGGVFGSLIGVATFDPAPMHYSSGNSILDLGTNFGTGVGNAIGAGTQLISGALIGFASGILIGVLARPQEEVMLSPQKELKWRSRETHQKLLHAEGLDKNTMNGW
jgi:hypothetical protein